MGEVKSPICSASRLGRREQQDVANGWARHLQVCAKRAGTAVFEPRIGIAGNHFVHPMLAAMHLACRVAALDASCLISVAKS